jgi:arylsulfatase A-like enzyme
VATAEQHWSWNEREHYRAEVTRVDRALARIAAALRALPEPERRLLIVTADHGEAFGEHESGRHGVTLYEPVLQVPLLAWAPGGDAASLVGAELPQSTLDLGSLVRRAVFGLDVEAPDHAFAVTHFPADPQVGVRRGGWKLVYHRRYHFTELFDLAADPWERVDLSEEHPGRVATLGDLLGAAMSRGRALPIPDGRRE